MFSFQFLRCGNKAYNQCFVCKIPSEIENFQFQRVTAIFKHTKIIPMNMNLVFVQIIIKIQIGTDSDMSTMTMI